MAGDNNLQHVYFFLQDGTAQHQDALSPEQLPNACSATPHTETTPKAVAQQSSSVASHADSFEVVEATVTHKLSSRGVQTHGK
nr:hypothetical protein CFP56_72086 [Quercus suber]